MTTKKILLISGIGFLTCLLFKKSAGKIKNAPPSPLKKFTTEVGQSIIKPLDEVADDVPPSSKFVNKDW